MSILRFYDGERNTIAVEANSIAAVVPSEWDSRRRSRVHLRTGEILYVEGSSDEVSQKWEKALASEKESGAR